jgi:hypothetical protein
MGLLGPAYASCSPRRLRGTPHSSVAWRANRTAARRGAWAFRGINGCGSAVVSRRWTAAIYSTVPGRRRLIAAVAVSHGDRRMRGSSSLRSERRGIQAESGSLGNQGRAFVELEARERLNAQRHGDRRPDTTVLTNGCRSR